MKLSSHEIAYLATRAGFDEFEAAPIITAIILAESGGDTDNLKINFIADDNEYDQLHGLAAINSRYHSELLMGSGNWRDPVNNLAMAYRIYKDAGNNFNYWETYKTNAYKKFLALAHFGVEYPVKPQINLHSEIERQTGTLHLLTETSGETHAVVATLGHHLEAIRTGLGTVNTLVTQIRRFFRD